MKNTLIKIAALLDADATVAAYEGYVGAKVSAVELQLPIHGRVAVFLMPFKTVETADEDNPYAGIARVKMFDHYVDIYCAMRLNVATTHSLLMDDGMLLDFTEDVKAALRQTNLDGTVKRVEIHDTEYAINVPASSKANWLVADKVEVMIRSLLEEC